MLIDILDFVATLCASLFAGAALYINLVEHPARMSLSTAQAAAQWAPSYKRATLMQAPLALASFIAATGAWLFGAHPVWLIAAVLIGAVVPFTFIGIMPTNRRISEPGRDLSSAETRGLLMRWGLLHTTRTVLSLVAAGLMIWAR